MEDFYRIRRLPPYVFEQVNRAKAAARNAGADIISRHRVEKFIATDPGTRFIIEIPIAADTAEEARAAESAIPATHV